MTDSFETLIEAGNTADVTGWDFAWLDGRATEERPPWGYARLLSDRLVAASASLDIQTGDSASRSGMSLQPSISCAR